MDSEKLRERVTISVFLTLLGATIGGLVGWHQGDALLDAIIGAILGALLSIVDVLFGSFLILVYVGGPILLIIAGIYFAFSNIHGWLGIFFVVGSICALLGGAIGARDGGGTRGFGKGALIGAVVGAAVTTLLGGFGVLGPNIPNGPNLPPHVPNVGSTP